MNCDSTQKTIFILMTILCCAAIMKNEKIGLKKSVTENTVMKSGL